MKHNFGAGPCILPQEVFEQAAAAVLDFNGLSILEVSHRHKDFVAVMDEALDLVKKALNVPAGYSVAYLQGGATLGFTIAALNMQRANKKAGYINTGTWASGAIKEAKKVGLQVDVFASSEDKQFSYIPKNYTISDDLDFVHFTSNNTIYGTQFKEIPHTKHPLVCDMSSDIFSKEIDVAAYDLIYAGAQKNLGPAGATLYIVKDDALGKSSADFMPTYLDLKQHVEKESMLNTPPVFSVYVAMLNLRHLIANGGVQAQEQKNKNAKHNIEVNGNCDMCKKRIEKAAFSVKGVKSADWHLDDHILYLIINEEKCSVTEVKQAIIKVGHDAEDLKATNEDYDKLHGCCRYERK